MGDFFHDANNFLVLINGTPEVQLYLTCVWIVGAALAVLATILGLPQLHRLYRRYLGSRWTESCVHCGTATRYRTRLDNGYGPLRDQIFAG